MKIRSLEKKRSLTGFLFTLPFIVGFILFFLIPVIQSMLFSVSTIRPDNGIHYDFVGFSNYRYLFKTDATFIPNLGNTVLSLFANLLMIIIFSFFIANILVQKFKGRLIARAVFFLPVIIASGIVISYIRGDANAQNMLKGANQSSQLSLDVMRTVLLNANIGADAVNFIMGMLNSIFEIPWKCGLQILIFMAGLQSISPSVKEAAKVEGATSWEFFWKVTLPILTPILQLNIIYTIIDSFTDYSNPIVKTIFTYNSKLDYSYASAMAWTYFSIIFVVVIVVFIISNRKTFSYD